MVLKTCIAMSDIGMRVYLDFSLEVVASIRIADVGVNVTSH